MICFLLNSRLSKRISDFPKRALRGLLKLWHVFLDAQNLTHVPSYRLSEMMQATTQQWVMRRSGKNGELPWKEKFHITLFLLTIRSRIHYKCIYFSICFSTHDHRLLCSASFTIYCNQCIIDMVCCRHYYLGFITSTNSTALVMFESTTAFLSSLILAGKVTHTKIRSADSYTLRSLHIILTTSTVRQL